MYIGEGSTCRFVDTSSKVAKTAIAKRKNSAIEAMKILGVNDYTFHDLPCGRFDQIPILEINKIIEKSIDEFSPDTVFTHSSKDTNSDHRILFNSTLMATRPVKENKVNQLFSYEILSSSEWKFNDAFLPNYFFSLEETHVKAKWEALKAYSSEIKQYPFPRSQEGVKALAMYRGMQAGFKYAESYELIRGYQG